MKTKQINIITKETAFEDVLQSIMPMIRSIAKQADGICGLEAEDVEQELAIQAYHSWGTWEPGRGAKFSTYVHDALVNRKNCLIRTEKAQKRNGGEAPGSLDELVETRKRDGSFFCLYDTLPDPSEGPEEQAEAKELWEAAERALGGMQEKGRDIVRGLLEGRTQLDISRSTGVSQPLIAYYLRSFRIKVRAELEKGLGE